MPAKTNQPKDLVDVIANGSMTAVAEIAQRHGFLDSLNLDTVLPALRLEIKNGFSQTARDAHEALILGEPMARAMLSASCVVFATNALKASGYLGGEQHKDGDAPCAVSDVAPAKALLAQPSGRTDEVIMVCGCGDEIGLNVGITSGEIHSVEKECDCPFDFAQATRTVDEYYNPPETEEDPNDYMAMIDARIDHDDLYND